MVEAILDILLPPRCGGCNRFSDWYCPDCVEATRRLHEPLCLRCGAESEFVRRDCGCRARLRSLGRLRSAAAFEGVLEKAIHRFKYGGRKPLATPLALLLAERLAIDGLPGEAVAWVPLHSRRRRRRGYNQAELLAGRLAAMAGLPLLPGLERTRDTPPQVGLDRLRRLTNVRGAFAWKGPPLARQAVILVDDVATTGATLEACAAALRAAGSGPVLGLTVARTPF